jgi:hypothetical protein
MDRLLDSARSGPVFLSQPEIEAMILEASMTANNDSSATTCTPSP